MKLSRLLSLGLAIALLSSNMVAVNASYTDVDGYAEASITTLVEMGALSGEGTFEGTKSATRGFVVEMLVKGMAMEPIDAEIPTFTDVPKTHPAYGYIEAAYAAGWISGDSKDGEPTGTFRPDDTINRAEMAKMVVNASAIELVEVGTPSFSDTPKSEWYTPFVQTAYHWSVINGYSDADGKATGKFGPGDLLVRQDTAVVVVNAQNKVEREDEVIEVPAGDDDTDVAGDDDSGVAVSTESSISVKYDVAAAELAEVDYKNVRHGEDAYTGTLPAPEGTVVSGLIGMTVKILPSGEGKYTYENSIWFPEAIACRDSVRTVVGSTGQAYEDAWWDGFELGLADFNTLLQVYDDTVPAAHAALPNIYKNGYDTGYYTNAPYSETYTCGDISQEDIDNDNYTAEALAGMDADGWSVYAAGELEDFDYQVAVPPGTLKDNDPDNPFSSADSKAYTIEVFNGLDEELKTNSKLDQIFFAQGDASETEDTMEELQTAIAEQYQALLDEENIGVSCQELGYWVSDYEVNSTTGYKGTIYSGCYISGATAEDQQNFIALSEFYYFLTNEGKLLVFSVDFDSRIDLDGVITLEEIMDTYMGGNFYDQEFVDQFLGKLML